MPHKRHLSIQAQEDAAQTHFKAVQQQKNLGQNNDADQPQLAKKATRGSFRLSWTGDEGEIHSHEQCPAVSVRTWKHVFTETCSAGCTPNQIKSLLLSHHHSTSALVSEILKSVLQTVPNVNDNVQNTHTYTQYTQCTIKT